MEEALKVPLRSPDGLALNPRFESAWNDDRRHLMDVAYRLLGTVSDAEDMVQEAYARLFQADIETITDARAWLTTVVTRLCLDELRSARVRREAYIGPWLPEPLLEGAEPLTDPAERITLDDSVRMAMLILLEELSPAERVVYVLHDIFQFPFEDVARMVDRTPAACRQLASRARRHLDESRREASRQIDMAEQRRITDRFIAAAESGELRLLMEVLDPAVAGWADLGGRVERNREPLVGRDLVAERILRIFGAEGVRLSPVMVNGEPGVLAIREEAIYSVTVLTVSEGRITKINAIADPRKLRHLAPLAGL
jgi:RNA polymerase sigma-70 factor (ECF subfamily)